MDNTKNISEPDTNFFISLESLRLLFNPDPIGIYRYDYSSKKYDFMSASIEKLTGYNIDEINKIGFSSIVKETIKTEHHLKQHEGMKDYIAKYLIQTKNLEYKWIEDIAFYNTGIHEKEKYSIGILRDITSLHNFLNGLYNETNKLDSILDLADVIFILTDSGKRIKMINQRGCELFGYEKDDIINKNLNDFISGENSYHNSQSKINESNVEIPTLTKSGEERIISWQIKTLNDNVGNNLYTIWSGQDITKKKKEEKIQQVISEILEASNSERNLDEFFRFVHFSISKLMPAENFYISLYNQENKMLTFPYFIDKVDETAPPKRFGGGLTEYVITTGKSALIDKKKDEELVAKGEVELIGSETEIWLGIPLKIQEKTIGALVLQDYDNKNTYGEREKEILEFISYPLSRAIERKKVEHEREELIEKLKELNLSKDKLFSLISHDLRSPFNSLLGFSEILTTEFDSLTHEEIREYLNVIYETSKNLFGMTNNLLHFSRFQMNRMEYNPKNINLKKMLESNLKMLKGNAIKKQINISVDIDSKVVVFADEEMINSVLQNIVSNAIKFTNKEGDIKISVKVLNFFNQPDQVEIKVTDSGIGISKPNLEKIFKERIQSTPGTEREYGTGLGLLLVKEFIEKNKGSIKLNSKLHQGTTFTFTLPIAQ